METKKIVVQLYSAPSGMSETLGTRDKAVKQAKQDLWTEVCNQYPGLEVSGLNTIFPMMVVSGPSDVIDLLSHEIMSLPPKRVRKVEPAWVAKIF